MDAFPQSVITINILINSSPTVISNLLVGNKNVSSDLRLSGTILGVTLANPGVITSLNHGLRTGNTIYITDVIGTTEINNTTFVVTYLTANTFSINVDSTLFTAYISGGNWQCNEDGFYVPGSEYAWFRFYATCTGQYLRVQMTYNNDLMSNIQTHKSNWILNSMSLWMRQGSKNIF